MKIIEKPSRSRSCFSRSMIERCVRMSSAVVGSSRITSCGSSISASAMRTRCFMPPDSSWGNAGSTRFASRCTRSRSSSARSRTRRLSFIPCARAVSLNCSQIVITGLKELSAAWNTMAASAHRYSRRSSSSSVRAGVVMESSCDHREGHCPIPHSAIPRADRDGRTPGDDGRIVSAACAFAIRGLAIACVSLGVKFRLLELRARGKRILGLTALSVGAEGAKL